MNRRLVKPRSHQFVSVAGLCFVVAMEGPTASGQLICVFTEAQAPIKCCKLTSRAKKGAYFYFPRSIDYPASLSAPHCPCVLRCHYELFQQNPIENIFTHQNEKLVCNEVIWPLFGKNSHILPFFFRAFLISLPISDSARVGNLSIPKFWFTQFLNVNSTDKWIPSDGHWY